MNEAFNIDCMEYMKGCRDKEFDLAIVDPPYGIRVMSMSYTKDGRQRKPYGKQMARRRDYHKQQEWDIRPKKEYFDELFRVSKHQIIWGGELLYRHSTAVKVLDSMGQTMQRFNDKQFCGL